MVFSSVTFMFYFLPITLALFYAVPRCCRQSVILIASFIFYAWGEPIFLLALLASVFFNHYIGLKIENEVTKCYLIIGIICNLLLLGVLKYANFVTGNVSELIPGITVTNIPLPLGISFFTFQSMAYLIDISRKEHKAQRSLHKTALYISMFPQLVAGPIVRYAEIENDLQQNKVTAEDFWSGIKLMMVGFSQKVLIANTIAQPVDEIFALNPEVITPLLAWTAIVGYSLQIFFDFAGYSLMAIGLGRMFGFHFPPNFNFPYIATSVTEFWRRWHITLSRWFRDYLYIPLGGNRNGSLKTYRNLLIVFIATGFWHGAAWTFLLWGLWHGLFLMVERAGLDKWITAMPRTFGHLYTLIAVMFGWILFRADTLEKTFAIWCAAIFIQQGEGFVLPWQMYLTNDVIIAICIGIVLSVPWRWERFFLHIMPLRTALIFVFFGFSLFSVTAGGYNPFIYFRF